MHIDTSLGSRRSSASDGAGEGVRKRDERETRQRGRLCESYSNGRVRELVIQIIGAPTKQRKN
jgi:hypothetical protein